MTTPHTPFDAQAQQDLLDWIASGRTLRDWCREAGFVQPRVVQRWLASSEEARKEYEAARTTGMEILAGECLEIADTESSHPDDVAHRKLRIWTRLQVLSRWMPAMKQVQVAPGVTALAVVTGVPHPDD